MVGLVDSMRLPRLALGNMSLNRPTMRLDIAGSGRVAFREGAFEGMAVSSVRRIDSGEQANAS